MTNESSSPSWRKSVMEILMPLGILAAWIILQLWVLPRMGVKT